MTRPVTQCSGMLFLLTVLAATPATARQLVLVVDRTACYPCQVLHSTLYITLLCCAAGPGRLPRHGGGGGGGRPGRQLDPRQTGRARADRARQHRSDIVSS